MPSLYEMLAEKGRQERAAQEAAAQQAANAYNLGGPGGGYTGLFGTKANTFTTPWGTTIQGDPTWQQLFGAGAQQAMQQQAPTLDNSQAQWAGQQSQLGQMLLANAQGQGPNPALAQLNQSTDRNIAQAYAMAQANSRNPAAQLNIANQAGAARQQMAGDAATMMAQQQLGAQNAYGNFIQGARAQDQGWALNAAQMQQAQNQYNQQNAQNYLGMGMGAANTQLQANIAQQQLNAQMANNAANRNTGILGGLIGGAGAVLGSALGGKGGSSNTGPVAPKEISVASGGEIPDPYSPMVAAAPAPEKYEEKPPEAVGLAKFGLAPYMPGGGGGGGLGGLAGIGGTVAGTAIGGPIGGAIGGALGSALGGLFNGGGLVPGDSPRNDVVPAWLSPREIVLPRSITMSEDAPEKAKAFVAAIQARKKRKAA